jgi:hypothetical protein
MAKRCTFLLTTALLALGLGLFGGCNVVLGIHDLSQGGAGGGCGDCDDHNPCTVDGCAGDACTHVAQPEGPAPSAAQTAFDCKVVQCVKGSPEQQNDDADIQADAEDCTTDLCKNGQALHPAKPDGAACTMGDEGLCAGGKCQISCTVDAMCDDGNPCTTDTCDVAKATCAFAPLNGVDTPGVLQIDFDCNVQVCVDGVSAKSPDDSDLPETATDCDQELCAGGVASNPPLSDTVTCGPNKDRFCDGAGLCVECNSPTQCPGIDDDCQARSCVGHVCGITHAPAGTPRIAALQIAGDCLRIVCDGAGHSAPPQIDDTDLPLDTNDCTVDVCNGGIPSHPHLPAGTSCGVNGACNSVGQCGCSNDIGCAAPETCGGGNPGTSFVCGCTKKTCAQLGKTCGTVTDGCTGTQSCDTGSKNGTETDVDCGGGAAGTCGDTCATGKQCAVDGDCGSGHCADGVCCNTSCTGTCLACSAAKKGGGTDGTCGSIAIGLQDSSATTACIGASACDGANGCKKLDGQICGVNAECVDGNCIDGICCNTPCTGSCLACTAAKKGSGVDGVCGYVAVNQADPIGAVPCTGNSVCDGSGVCKSKAGQTCNTAAACAGGNCIDGVCCGVTGCPACQSCALGPSGTCGNIPLGMPDLVAPNTCSGAMTCDGGGTCKKALGVACTLTQECATGACVDGVCCGVASCPACKSCAIGGNGTCGNLPSIPDTAQPNTCSGVSSCDGSGNCKKANGQTCAATSECATGTCVDGVCCGVATCPVCLSCALGPGGTCGFLPAGGHDTAAPGTCLSTMTCDGSGNCKKANGSTCGVTSECATGTCVDGVCCGVASCPACQSCAVGPGGTCGNLPPGPDSVVPNTCNITLSCDGGGNCKLGSGQSCITGSQCASGTCNGTKLCQ